jgi:carboxypeptidase D
MFRYISIALTLAITSATPQLHHPSHYEVNRHLLEKNYPAFKTFKGSMYSGLIPAVSVEEDTEDFSEYFFWLFRPEVDTVEDEGKPESFRDDTLLIWLNGGPGCSSLIGLMSENGPVTIPNCKCFQVIGMQLPVLISLHVCMHHCSTKVGPGIPAPNNPASAKDAPLVENAYAWTKKSAMIFVEQPGGTGFSTASSAWTGDEASHRTEDDVAQNFYDFMQNLYQVFGDELREKKLYVSGESYAGFYVPSIARGIYLRNKQVDKAEKLINIAGVAIGNGWIDAYVQVSSITDSVLVICNSLRNQLTSVSLWYRAGQQLIMHSGMV